MSVHNNAPHLAPAIESVLTQSFGDFEMLILNDGSTDGSAAIIDQFAAADPRVRAIHQGNCGLITSLNRLLAEARAPLVARMDGDDIALPERFARQRTFLLERPDYGVVGTRIDIIDDKGRRLANRLDHPTSFEDLLATLEGGPVLCHPSVMMRRDLVLAVGGYRGAYRHCEDYDLWLRLVERTKLCSLPERLLHYRHSLNQVSSRHTVAQQMGAAVAWLAHLERASGRPDPTEGLNEIPPIEKLDDLFGRAGIARAVRAKVAPGIVYSPVALRGDGYKLLVDYVREGGARLGLWRTAARLVKLREPRRALGLAAALTLG
jgi:hypothetical protein